jgi:hypothetical protein
LVLFKLKLFKGLHSHQVPFCLPQFIEEKLPLFLKLKGVPSLFNCICKVGVAQTPSPMPVGLKTLVNNRMTKDYFCLLT